MLTWSYHLGLTRLRTIRLLLSGIEISLRLKLWVACNGRKIGSMVDGITQNLAFSVTKKPLVIRCILVTFLANSKKP